MEKIITTPKRLFENSTTQGNNKSYSRKINQILVIDLNANLNSPNLSRNNRRDIKYSKYISNYFAIL